jgi:hypothetical protein
MSARKQADIQPDGSQCRLALFVGPVENQREADGELLRHFKFVVST